MNVFLLYVEKQVVGAYSTWDRADKKANSLGEADFTGLLRFRIRKLEVDK